MADFDPNAEVDQSGLVLDKIYCPACNRENKVGVTFCAHCAAYMGDLEDDKPAPAEGQDAFASFDPNAAEEEEPPPPPPPPSAPPTPPASDPPRAAAADATPESDPDVLDEPVTLPDGRVIKRASTLAKLQKLQKIVGDQSLLGGGAGGNEIVSYLEKKVSEQAAQIEALKQEKEAIVAEFMADALEGDADDAVEALEKEREKTQKLEAKLEELHQKREALSDKLAERTDQMEALRQEIASLKEGGAGADEAALRQEISAQFEETLAARQSELEAAQARVQELEAGGGQETQALQERIAALEQEVAAQTARADEAARAAQAAQAAQGEGGGADPAELEALKAQLTKVSNAAKEQVGALTRYYERILARSPSGLMVLDKSGTILSVNPAASKELGVPATELIRKPASGIELTKPLAASLVQVFAEDGDGNARGAVTVVRGDHAVELPYTAGRAELGARQVSVIAFDPVAAPGADGGGEAPGADVLAALQEDLFALRMMVELLSSKAGNEGVVTNVSQNLLGDLDRMIEGLKG